jgi:hypothetical protein
MAQTKRKRRTKHRGTAAGVVEARGRTGRPLSAEERKKQTRQAAREARLAKPPTWGASAKRAALAGVFLALFLYLTYSGKHTTGSARIVAALGFAVVAVAIYIPAGYYLERLLWRRRQAKKQALGR